LSRFTLDGDVMNNKRTFRIVLHVRQDDMVKIVQAARALKVNPHDFVVQTAVERAKRVLAK
jgi:uncharacterized protein (DUF1778 family)